ncbi:MAG: hypothetical protein KJO53_02000, partial [Eudoraea sp.]|nr:hypothetical protein [Eudoraea sp.]
MFNYEAEVNEIYFNTKYVSGRALDAITDFTNNTYIIKGSTGIGGTTALLNYTKGHCLIVSPNVGMIQSKELNRGKYDSAKQLFMYSNSKDQWKDWNDYSNIYDNIIISTTPNQLLKIRNENRTLYNDIIKIPVFIDEIHAFTVDSDYRIELGQFLELVYNEWEAVFKLSTATPNYNFLDVPTDKNVDFYKLIRENQPIKKIQLSSDLKDAKQFIQNQHLKGRLVICFTNNINFHKSFTGLRVKNLVGQTLDIKLKPYDRGLKLDEDLYEETDVIFLSSSYFAGFDILKDCSVCIISEQANEAYKINVNNVAQGYGRCRANIHDALFVNATAPYTKGKSGLVANPQITLNQVNKAIDRYSVEADYWNSTLDGITYYSEVSGYPQITRHLYINRAVILAPILNVVYDYQLYNEAVIYEVLERYGFEISAYENEDESFVINENKIPFKSRIKNLIELDETQLYNSYLTTKHSLKFKEKGKYNTKLALEYLTTYLIKISNAEKLVKKLDNKRMRPNEYYKCMDLFLRVNSDTTFYHEQLSSQQQCSAKMLYKDDHTEEVLTAHIHMINDWQMLYASHKVTNNILSSEIEREIKLYELFYDYDLYQELNVDKNRIRNGKRAIIKRCKQQSILLDNDELEWLDEVIKSTYKALDNGDVLAFNNGRKVIKNKMTNALVYLLTDGHIYKFKEIKNREYNPLT